MADKECSNIAPDSLPSITSSSEKTVSDHFVNATQQSHGHVTSDDPGEQRKCEAEGEVNKLSNRLDKLETGDAPQSNLCQIDADMMQIDSILKALNSGTFDQGNMMTIDQLTAKKPKNVISAVQLAPSAGLSLIGELSSDEDDSSSSSDSEDASSDNELAADGDNNSACDSDEDGRQTKSDTRKHGYPMVKGEVDYRDLPPEEVKAEDCPQSVELTSVGTVKSVTEKLIVIESLNNSSPLDEGTVFWNSNRQAVGKLFETFGPVKKPFYSSRVNESALVQPGEEVLVALGDSNLTKFAFMQGIMGMKGSDASWMNDEEIPVEYQDFSDDEKEMLANREKRKTHSSKRAPSKKTESCRTVDGPPHKGWRNERKASFCNRHHSVPSSSAHSTPPPPPAPSTHHYYPPPPPPYQSSPLYPPPPPSSSYLPPPPHPPPHGWYPSYPPPAIPSHFYPPANLAPPPSQYPNHNNYYHQYEACNNADFVFPTK